SMDFTEIRRRFTGAYMANGGYPKERANAAIAEGRADLVSFGVPFLANPDLVRRFELDAPLNEPNPDTFYGGGAEGYTDYPSLDQPA
ncbi:MAG: alkene reductase, partial [Candidatus Dadabacteria bacterium]